MINKWLHERGVDMTPEEIRRADVIGPFPMDCGFCAEYMKNRYGRNETYSVDCKEHSHLLPKEEFQG